ncbi:titin isoform X3 [Cephus cinctus]|uniref:Titin isoform X3 n=1 Tax=Cephus cinctus TaxID=211228 RepID=A0AAJ7CC29_CEPCN|nr:titin isoform X3 [Cephus cinctus]
MSSIKSRLEAVDILEALESKLVYLPGGRDREGRSLVIVNVPGEPLPTTKSRLELLIKYLISIFSEETKENGFTLLIDAQRGSWRVARSCIRQSLTFMGSNANSVIVLRPDGFWDKHVDNCTKSYREGEPVYIPITRLTGYIDTVQLPQDLGGTKVYNHLEWIQTRVRVEEYTKDAVEVVRKMTDLHQRLRNFMEVRVREPEVELAKYSEMSLELRTAARYVLHSGRNVVSSLSRETSQDILDTVQRIHRILDSVELKQHAIERTWIDMERSLGTAKEIDNLEDGVARVTNWILGPADSMLNSRYQVGFDVSSSEELRREHEKLELECRETYGRYAELLHKIDSLPVGYLPEDLKSQRDFMDFVCRSFASRLERRRNVLITSQRFFRLVSEYFDRTSEVFDKLVMGNKVYNFSQAGSKLLNLEKNQEILEAIERELVKEGEKLSDILSMPVKDALGRDIHVDYGEDIVNVRDILDATNARKNIFNDSVELQKLTLKQVALIYTYENDAEQAVQWLNDLFKVLIDNHVQIGCNVNEIQSQKEDQQSFQETAKGTYDYGCQLVNGARVLRISCRLALDDNTNLSKKLWQAWRQLRSVGQEQLTRLRVCAVFHRSVEDHCTRLVELIDTVGSLQRGSMDSESMEAAKVQIRDILGNREKLLLEVGRMVRLGRLLRTRLKEPLCHQRMSDDDALLGGGNLTAVEAISTRLAEVTRLAERLDGRLCEAGARTQAPTSSAADSLPSATTNGKDSSEVVAGIKKILEGSDDAAEESNKGTKDKMAEDAELILSKDSVAEESATDGYVTAPECPPTPIPQSRSESFVTSSECDDAVWWNVDNPVSDVENVEISSLKDEEKSRKIPVERIVKVESADDAFPKKEISKSDEPKVDRSSASTIIKKTVEEKLGTVVKEVTETTTLRVSHSTHLGVTSYKLTSNTLRDNKEHTDIKEIQDFKRFAESDASAIKDSYPTGSPAKAPTEMEHRVILTAETDRPAIALKKESSQDTDESLDGPKDHSRLLKFTKGHDVNQDQSGSILAPSQSSTQSSYTSKDVKESLSLEEVKRQEMSFSSRHTNDSGIELSPKKDTKEEDDLLDKMKRSGEWFRLKVLEVRPGLTSLGASAEEATELLNAHDEVLLQLQSKQSPVEELLRQADQLISTQRPRAEVYAAMAETLGQAWRDVNTHLEHRKQILDSNVLFQCRAEEYRENMKALEMACNDTLLPIEIDAVKNFLTKIHDLRKTMLESLMGALQEGKTLLDKLREVSNEGSLDSRPDHIKAEADHAILQVERWLEELHDKRRLIEISFQSRKTQLEQCLALALLATDLRDLEEILNDRVSALASSSDQLGDSSSSAELLLFELKKLQPEAKEFQDRSIKITKLTEQLVSSGHFAGEQATEQAYAILSSAADYINDLDQYESLLNRAIAFFRLAQSGLTKLDQLEIQLITTDHPPHSAQLAQLHAQAVATLEDVTAEPLAEGYALLDVTGRGAPGAEGVRRMVEELENRKIQMVNHCTADNEENLRIAQELTAFLEKHNQLYSWLVGIAEAFLQGHQEMGSVLPMAQDFHQLHYKLLSDLQKKGDEINEVLKSLPPIVEFLEDQQRRDVDEKVDVLHGDWLKLKNLVDARLQLSSLYVKFHEAAAELANEIDAIETEFKKNGENLKEGKIEELEKKWMALQPLYLKLTSTGKQFLDEAREISDPYLDILRARLCVETLLEHFANRQLTLTESWETWQNNITILKERQIEQERTMEESTRTIQWVSKFDEQLYPVITTESMVPSNILENLEITRSNILPELKKAVSELDVRIKTVSALMQNDDDGVNEQIKNKLLDVHQHLQNTTSEYQILLESLISIFKNVVEVERRTQEIDRQTDYQFLPKDADGLRSLLKKHEETRESVEEILKTVTTETEKTVERIKRQEPPDAAEKDIEKLRRVIELKKLSVDSLWHERKVTIEETIERCVFQNDLGEIKSNLNQLSNQLSSFKGQYGENLPAAKSTSESFKHFETTMTVLETKIETFITTTKEKIITTYELAPYVREELSKLEEKLEELKKEAEESRRRVNLSIDYFKLLEEAEEWFREGSKLLITIARKATMVKVPEDATNLLHDVDTYLKPGEDKQEERIRKIRELSTHVFGTERLPQFNEVVVENREMLDAFTMLSSELQILVQDLKNAENRKEMLKREQEEADAKLSAARAEAMAAQVAAAEAENARRAAELLAAQTVERATEEARKLAEIEGEKARRAQIEKQKALTSVSAQTETEINDTQTVQETLTSAVTTKEIHILQKTEIEEAIPISVQPLTPQREASPPKVSKTDEVKREPVPPVFTVPLNNATIQEGERLTFECRVTGYPEPEVVWYKDGISILNNPDYLTSYENGVCTLTIEETFAEDSAQFTCRAFNTAGSAETMATLTVKETAPEEQLSPPVFIKGLQPSFAIEGTPHLLECTVEGNPLPTVQWFKNESNIDNSPDYIITYNNGEAILKFEEVFLDDQATYTCKAVNQVGQASTSASLSVEPLEPTEKPYFVTPLSNIMARAGQKVKLECEAKGIPTPNLNWSHNGKSVKESRDLKIQTEGAKSTLVISEAFPKDAGSYSVSARNLAGEATSSCNVSVKGRLPNETSDSELPSDMEPVKPSIQLPLKDLQVVEGQTVRLDCVIVGQPEPEVIWYHDGQPVKESADFQLLFQGDRCSLIIHEAFLDDAGDYKVVAINSGGEASSQCILSVVAIADAEDHPKSQVEEVPGSPPKFIKLLTDVLVAEGEETVFECIVTGDPKPDLKWFLNNSEIIENERIRMNYQDDGTGTLRISRTIPEDKGNYIAKATNHLGEAKAFAHLIVKSLSDFQIKEEIVKMEEKLIPPTFKERFLDRTVPEGTAIKFECIVTGKPNPKIQWLFNDQPVCGKDFLTSVSGERQVLTIPETGTAHNGTISCVAENAAGKAICQAHLEIGGGTNAELELIQVPTEEMQASNSSEKHFSTEKTSSEGGSQSVLTKISSTVTQSSSSHTSTKKEYTSSTTSTTLGPSNQPTSVCVKSTTKSSEQSSSENGAPPVVQSHKVEEYERIIQDKPGEIRQEKTVIVSKGEEGTKLESKMTQVQKPVRKSVAPRFVSPVTGMIVDQGTDIVLEGIVDGFPQPTIAWSKNGQELKEKEGVKISYAHNHVRVEIKNVNVKDAGRYTCSAVNDVGTASSTADLVVKKTIFPPVFGRRLQAQVVKRGERVIMEVEITGTPEPTVTWYKNDVPLKEQPPEVRIQQQGNCYLLIINKADKEHAGKYMVRATNAGGEAQSIADFAVFEPTPDTMVEVHKTVVYENVQDKGIVQPDGKKVDVPSGNLTAEHISTTKIQPSSGLKTLTPSSAPASSSSIRTVKTIEETHPVTESHTTRSETISSTIESHHSETKSEQKFHMKLEHKTPTIIQYESTTTKSASGQPQEKVTVSSTSSGTNTSRESGQDNTTQTTCTKVEDKSIEVVENENVETSTIARKDALSFFESKSKESTESVAKGPKEMIKLAEDVGPGYEVKVGKLTKNYERSTKFEEVKRNEPAASDYQTTKKAVQDIFTKIEQGPSPRGIDNKLIEFPYEGYKLPPLEIKRTILEDTTASGSPIHGTLTISKLQAQSESAEAMMSGFNLVPEPPPEIGYMPKVEVAKKKRPDISVKVKQLQESHKNLSPVEAPIGGVKIFPSPAPKAEPKIETPKPSSRPSSTVIPPPFELHKQEVMEDLCIKKDVHEKKFQNEIRTEPAPAARPVTPTEASPVPPFHGESSYASDFETRSHVSTDLSDYRCHSVASSSHMERASSPKPSADALAMEKSWAHKCTDSSKKSWPPQESQSSSTATQKQFIPGQDFKAASHEVRQEVQETSSGLLKTNIESSSTLEKKSWSTREEQIVRKVVEQPAPPKPEPKPIIYNAETIKVDHTINPVEQRSLYEKYISECDVHKTETTEKTILEERGLKPSELKKSWPPGLGQSEELKAPQLVKNVIPKPVIHLYHTVEPEPILEPGPPPEIAYASGPIIREKKVEKIEKTLEMSLEQPPAKIPPGAVRTIPPPPKRDEPPPIPPKDVHVAPPPLPAKFSEPKRISPTKPLEKFPDLEPFPYQGGTAAPKSARLPPPPTPTKFVKGSFGESDYESDFEGPFKPKWRPYESDNEEPRYRRVKAPIPKQPTRPKSTEPEPLPPSSFEIPPPEFTGPPRPNVARDYQEKSYKKTMTRHERDMKHQQHTVQTVPTPVLQPGSPPIYVQPKSPKTPPVLAPKSPTKVGPESPKFKVKTFQQESGYMADTDEPIQQRSSTVHKNFSKHEGSSSSHSESHTSYSESHSQFIKSQTFTSSQQKDFSSGSFSQPTPKPQVQHSTLVEKTSTSCGTDSTQFNPTKETFYSVSQSSEKSQKLEPFPFKAEPATSTPRKMPPPPSPSKFIKGEFRESDYESDYEGRIPPVWKPHGSDTDDYSFKPVKPNLIGSGKARPRSTEPLPTPPTVFDTPPQYSGPPRPEFKPIEKSSLSSLKSTKETREVKQFKEMRESREQEQQRTQRTLEKPKPATPKPKPTPQPKLEVAVATPTKPKSVLLPGSPPEMGYVPPKQQQQRQTFYEARSGLPFHNAIGTETKKTVRMDESTENTRRVVTVEQTSRVIKFGENESSQNNFTSYGGNRQHSRFQVPTPTKFVQGQFRESDYESDADIRIKPKWTPADSDTEDLHYRKVQPPRSARSSSVPVQRERERVMTPMEFDTQPPVMPQETSMTQHLLDINAENKRLQRLEEMRKRFDSQTQIVKQQQQQQQQDREKILKPGSPPEFGFVSKQDVKNAANYVASKHMSDMTSSFKSKTEKFVNDIQSDLKKKPILKHKTDGHATDGDEPQAYREETRSAQYGSPWPSNGMPTSKEVIQPYQDILPKKAPVFITPLRDIAVVSGQTARFECIVQAEPQPNILWSKDGRIIETSSNYEVQYRNGVCRLTIPRAYPEDGGTYSCTATNSLGSTGTSATLQVPGNRRSVYTIK